MCGQSTRCSACQRQARKRHRRACQLLHLLRARLITRATDPQTPYTTEMVHSHFYRRHEQLLARLLRHQPDKGAL